MYKQKLFKITVSFISIMVLLLGASTIYVTQFEKRSVQSKIVEIFLNAQGGKDIFTNREKLAEFMKEREKQNEKSYVIPNDVELISTVKEENISGMQVLSLNRKKGKNKMQILYLHGGAYINQPTNVHMTFLDKVASDTNAEITVPIYPKAPVHQFREAFEKVLPIYEELLTKTEPKNIVIMGDSAGGGFSLALSQMLLEKNLLQPGNIILLSPWLDITMKNPLIPTFEDKDPMLGAYWLDRDR
ncbi:hypothetical protein C6370_04755 [Bacillus atrophaeus]|uniref:alpha/beta hydrolase fold domain-containing protein n=1 Tax=Bacillus atrophaeus TaxID=1452 RepID=UPI000D05E84F|nr:alpha/beta hydrolase [Bacillus atrophaeus]PSA96647.1 hypothetical protein C6370_04755 [Bacillus atrophaeus]